MTHRLAQMRNAQPIPTLDVTRPALAPTIAAAQVTSPTRAEEVASAPPPVAAAPEFVASDGWIEWKGGDTRPVPEGSRLLIKIRGGTEQGFETTADGEGYDWWKHFGGAHDIIAYKVLP